MDEQQIMNMISNHGHLVSTSWQAKKYHVIPFANWDANKKSPAMCGALATRRDWNTTPNMMLTVCDKCLVMCLRRGWLHN